MKEQILPLIPEEETELISKVTATKDRYDLVAVLIEDFGKDKSTWEPWQLDVESAYLEEIAL